MTRNDKIRARLINRYVRRWAAGRSLNPDRLARKLIKYS